MSGSMSDLQGTPTKRLEIGPVPSAQFAHPVRLLAGSHSAPELAPPNPQGQQANDKVFGAASQMGIRKLAALVMKHVYCPEESYDWCRNKACGQS